jgi:uncharacterized membrane protein
METLTLQLSNTINQLVLLAILLTALFRLTDGMRQLWTERISLIGIMAVSFFLMASNAHPQDYHISNSVVHPTIVVAQYCLMYFKFKSSDQWTFL